jgi:hypothetical protein
VSQQTGRKALVSEQCKEFDFVGIGGGLDQCSREKFTCLLAVGSEIYVEFSYKNRRIDT